MVSIACLLPAAILTMLTYEVESTGHLCGGGCTCFRDLGVITCTGRLLNAIPTSFTPSERLTTTILDMKFNILTRFKFRAAVWPRLQLLDLRANDIDCDWLVNQSWVNLTRSHCNLTAPPRHLPDITRDRVGFRPSPTILLKNPPYETLERRPDEEPVKETFDKKIVVVTVSAVLGVFLVALTMFGIVCNIWTSKLHGRQNPIVVVNDSDADLTPLQSVYLSNMTERTMVD